MDARIVIDEYRLKLRTTGIIIHDNKILIEKYDDKVYFLPGEQSIFMRLVKMQ